MKWVAPFNLAHPVSTKLHILQQQMIWDSRSEDYHLTCRIPVLHQVSVKRSENTETLVKTIISEQTAFIGALCRTHDRGGLTSSSPQYIIAHQFAPLLTHSAAVQQQITWRHVRQYQTHNFYRKTIHGRRDLIARFLYHFHFRMFDTHNCQHFTSNVFERYTIDTSKNVIRAPPDRFDHTQ